MEKFVQGCLTFTVICTFQHKKEKEYEKEGYELDASMSYMFLQTTAYGVMAATIMRLKLFWTPNLCIMAGMLASKK